MPFASASNNLPHTWKKLEPYLGNLHELLLPEEFNWAYVCNLPEVRSLGRVSLFAFYHGFTLKCFPKLESFSGYYVVTYFY